MVSCKIDPNGSINDQSAEEASPDSSGKAHSNSSRSARQIYREENGSKDRMEEKENKLLAPAVDKRIQHV